MKKWAFRVEGIIKKENGNICLDIGITKYKLPNNLEKIEEMEQKQIILGIRPENITLLKENVDNSIKAKIEIIEPMGREIEVHLDIKQEKKMIVLIRNIDDFKIGDEIYLKFDNKKLHFFNKETGENIYQKS